MESSASIRRPQEGTAELKTQHSWRYKVKIPNHLNLKERVLHTFTMFQIPLNVKSPHDKLSVFPFTVNPNGSFISLWDLILTQFVFSGSHLFLSPFCPYPPHPLHLSLQLKSQYVVIGASINHTDKAKVSNLRGNTILSNAKTKEGLLVLLKMDFYIVPMHDFLKSFFSVVLCYINGAFSFKSM